MPRRSERGKSLIQSPIRSLLPFARQAKKEGKKVFHLNIGQPDIPTPPEALAAIRTNSEKIISYGPSEGLTSLRAKVVQYYQKFDANLDIADVFITTGASEAILFTFFSCFDEHDELIIPEPFYANYLGFAATSSINIVPITTTFEEAFRLPDIEAFEAIISPRTKGIFLCNPGNPTGQLYSKNELEQLIQLVIKHDIYLIVDEVYREFCYDAPFTSVLSFTEAKKHVIVIDSVSKVFSSCGARIGFLITKNKEVQQSVIKYAQLRLCPPYLGQVLAEACFDNGAEYINASKKEYNKRRHMLYKGLKAIDGIECYMPNAAFYNIIQLPFDDVEPFCKWLLSDFSLNNQTVMLAPASGFYFNQELGKSQVRIAYVLNEEDLAMALECLKTAIVEFQEKVLVKS